MAQQSSPASTFESTGDRHQTGELRLSRDVRTVHIAADEYGRGIEHTRENIKHRLVTEGDSLDECPSWVPGTGRRLVFQSAGIARDQNGHPRDQSCFRVEQLDLDSQKMDVVVEDVRFDYLAPRMDSAGNLFAVRRPYESRHPRVSPLQLLKDILLFPFRVLMAIAAFLNVFSMFFRQQPLYRAGGPESQEDSQRMVLFGRLIDI